MDIFSSCYIDACQSATANECSFADSYDRIGNCHACQSATSLKRTAADGGDWVADAYAGHSATIRESTVTDGCNRVGDDDAGQAAAIRESTVTDGCNRVGDDDAGQAAAVFERTPADCSDGIGRAVIGDYCRNGHVPSVFVRSGTTGDGGFITVDVIVDSVDLNVVGEGGGWQQEGQQQEWLF